MESIKLWIALTPKQLEELNKGNEVFPDEYSGRFGQRLGPKEAVDRAQYFMDWTPEGLKGEFHQKDVSLGASLVTLSTRRCGMCHLNPQKKT